MVPMTFIWWIYHFWARFWPYFSFVDFRAYFGPFSLVNRDQQKMADLLMKMASNKKMQENKPTLKFNFTIEKRWPVSIFELFGPQHLSHWALMRIVKVSIATFSNISKIQLNCESRVLIKVIPSKTLPKAQRTRGLSSSFQSNLLGHITSSNTNLDQTSSSKSQPSIYFKISTKHHHLD